MTAKTVLLVEDDRRLSEFVQWALQERGYTVLAVSYGETGLSLVGSADLVLLNLKLPGVSGLEVLRKVRDAGNYVPIIVISGVAGERERAEAEAHKVVEFVEKPFSVSGLLEKIDKAVGFVEHVETLAECDTRLQSFIERQTKN